MEHGEPALILRKKPVADGNEIALDQWLSYVASSPFVRAKPKAGREGIDPFTRKPRMYWPPPGGALFEGPGGRCDIEYHAGGLIVRGATGHAEHMVAEIAEALGAEVRRF